MVHGFHFQGVQLEAGRGLDATGLRTASGVCQPCFACDVRLQHELYN